MIDALWRYAVITGIGVDLIEVNRVAEACKKESFLNRCFTGNEIELIKSDVRIAADNFAVKEAVAKMLGTGFVGFSPHDIEVLRDEKGKPYVNLFGKADEIAKKQGVNAIHVSISNTRDYANAFVVGESI